MFLKSVNDMENAHDLLGKKQDIKLYESKSFKNITYTHYISIIYIIVDQKYTDILIMLNFR